MQRVFVIDEIQSLVYKTGNRRPLPGIKLEDKKDLISTLISYYSMIRVKAAMDQFCFGLQSLELYQEIKFDPLMWDKFFIATKVKLTAGTFLLCPACCAIKYMYIVLSLADVKSLFQFEFSEEGSNELAAENQTYINFIDFLDECEC